MLPFSIQNKEEQECQKEETRTVGSSVWVVEVPEHTVGGKVK